MADFQPRFVDLVRSYTSTAGTGAFALGPAVNGFTGFGSALQAGDSFYYSAIGVDKPAEREVGRGTLQANGTISRQPLSGAPTNFSSGTKSIALIAAAEWFNLVQAGAGSQPVVAATRSALAASPLRQVPGLLTESGCEGMFVFDSSDLSAKVAADTRQGLYVAPASDPTGASGAWVRKFDGAIRGAWFRIAGDGTTNDGPAVAAAVTAALAHAGTDIFGFGTATPTIELPFARNAIKMGTTTIALTKAIRMIGHSGGTFGGAATALEWDAGVNGIEVRAANAYLDRLSLKGGWVAGVTSEGECHAIKAYAKFGYGQLYICDWQGDGIHVNVTAGSGGDTEGNANGLYGGSLTVNSCRVGLSLAGADANAGFFGLVDANYNRQAGVLDATAFGNGYGAIQTSGNGVQGISGTAPVAAFKDGRFFVVKSGQATGASTNSPPASATSNSWWLYWKDAGAATAHAPQWVSGMTFREGGAVYVPSSNASNSSTIDHLYSEEDQPPVQVGPQALIKGGKVASGFAPETRYIAASSAEDGVNIGPKLNVKGMLSIKDQVQVDGITGHTDTFTFFDIGNALGYLWGRNWNTGGGREIGHIAFHVGFGVDYNAQSVEGGQHRFLVDGGTLLATISNAGLDIAGHGMFSGTVSGSNLSGTNTGDQVITLTGDVTGSGTGSFAASIASNAVTTAKIAGSAVTYAKIQNVSASSKLLGRASAGAGVVEEVGLASGLTISGTNLTLGAITPTSSTVSGAIKSTDPAAGVGYGTGAGGTVTQATSKSTGVTLNKASGQITTHNGSLAAAALVSFTVTNSTIAATDTINLNLASGNATAGTYRYWAEGVAAGSFKIVIENRSAGSLSEALTFNLAVIKAVAA